MAKTVLLFGDQSDPFVEGIDYVCQQAEHQPWLRSFLTDSAAILHDETRHWEHALRDRSMGNFHTIQELSDQYRHRADETGLAHGLLVFIMRQSLLLQCIKREPALLTDAETISVCGGFLNAAALNVSKDLDTLYEASLELLRVLCRLEKLAYDRARASDLSDGSWASAVTGMPADKLQIALDRFQTSIGTPDIKRVKIGIIGQGWCTIIGPPTTLTKVLQQCTAIKNLPQRDLSIRGPFHTLIVSETEFANLLGSSSLLDIDTKEGPWKSTVRMACEHVLTRPFDLAEAVKDLNSRLGSVKIVDLNVIGTSSHANSVLNQLKANGKEATMRHEHLFTQPSPNSMPDNFGKIAIIGMGGQAPGADNLNDFWKINIQGLDMHKKVPDDRFDLQEFYSATHEGVCTTNAPYGCFIDRPGAFDARFFNVSHREALLMEPCHRLFLMSVYEALEMSGYSQDRTRTTDPNRIGAFFGQSVSDWRATTHPRGCNSYDLQGVQRAFGPGRVNYHFKWEGPSYNIDSACASSASAITLACQNLLLREIDMAVAGGSNAISSPHAYCELSRAGILSVTGNCKPYRDDADGYCRAEFSGAVVLKRLEDAVAANDNILAVIAASARTSSGNASSITTSDADAQQRLFRQVLSKAHIAPEEISYVEMHGTGTQIGDLAEMNAVVNTFKRPKHENNPLRVGAVKANIGHSEGAAGVASLMKCILSLQKEILPPVANMPHKLNPNFPDLKACSIDIPAQSVDFKASAKSKRRMIVNNFDASGGNTCVLIEDFVAPKRNGTDPRSAHVITVSAKSTVSQTENRKRLLEFLKINVDNCRIEDLAYTTTARRIHYPYRTAFTATSIPQVIEKLEADIASNDTAKRVKSSPIVFMFTGQGSHYAGMGAVLYQTNKVFREKIDFCVAICKQHGFPDFLDIITNPSIDAFSKTTIETQLAVVCLEIALASFWRALSIEPALVMGHSVGEYAALHVAGVLSLADVLFLVGRRAQLILERCEPFTCSMLSVVSSPDHLMNYVKKKPSCQIACLNSPKATVISGPADEIKKLQGELEKDGIRCQKLQVPYAFHSNQIDVVLDDYATLARTIPYNPPKIPIASTLSASIIDQGGIINDNYLVGQMREKVDYVGALNAAAKGLEDPLFLEIGPKRVLGGFVPTTLPGTSSERISSTLEGTNQDWSSISRTLASLYNAGVDIDWTAFHQPFSEQVKVMTLPTYSWELRDYWLKWSEPRGGWLTAPAPTEAPKAETVGPISKMLHFVESESLSPKLQFTFRSSVADPYLQAIVRGHRLRMIPVCPGGVYCEIGMEAAKYALERQGDKRTDLVVLNAAFNRPFTMPEGTSTADILTTITMPNENLFLAKFAVKNGNTTTNIGQCHFEIVDKSAMQAQWDRTSYFIKACMDRVIDTAKRGDGHRFKRSVFYSLFSRTLDYDGPFKGIEDAYLTPDFGEAVGEVILQEDPSGSKTSSAYWTDSLVHLAGFVANANPIRPSDVTFVTNGFEDSKQTVEFTPGGKYFSYVKVTKSDDEVHACDVFVFDTAGRMVMQCTNLSFRKVENASLERILGKTSSAPLKAPKSIKSHVQISNATTGLPTTTSKAPVSNTAAPIPTKANAVKPKKKSVKSSKGPSVLDTLLSCVATETGTDAAELTDDAVFAELGVDSIMAMQIVATVKKLTDFDIPSAFVFQCPTVGSIRKELGSAETLGPDDPQIEIEEEVEQSVKEAVPTAPEELVESSSTILKSLLHSISEETGTDLSDLSDDSLLSELGCDSIMALQIAATVKRESGYDLQGTFVLEYPSIGNLRRAFGDPRETTTSHSHHEDAAAPKVNGTIPHVNGVTPQVNGVAPQVNGFAPTVNGNVPQVNGNHSHVNGHTSHDRSTQNSHTPSIPKEPTNNLATQAHTPQKVLEQDSTSVKFSVEGEDEELMDFADVPESKVILLQGKPSSKEIPLFLMADGFGTAATYIHLPRFKSGLPVYAIESAFLRCPGKLTRKAGIYSIAKFAVDAIIKARPQGPYLLGGFSGGATICYEICRQLAATGRRLQGLMLIDMICPRVMDESKDAMATQGMPLVQRLSPFAQKTTVTSKHREKFGPIHLRRVVSAVCHYDPPALAVEDRPDVSCIIWAKQGLIELAKSDTEAMAIMSGMNLGTELPDGFMTDARLGPGAWSIPSKKGIDLGVNGWDAFLGDDIKVLVADTDHLSMPVPPDVHKLHKCMVEALDYFTLKGR